MASYNWNWPAIVTNSGPIQFLLDGVVTTVSEDTGTPANSKPLPVLGLNPSGNPQDTNYGVVGGDTLRTAAQIGNATGAASFGAGAVGAQTLRTALASDQLSVLATAANQATEISSLASIDTKLSAPIDIKIDQTGTDNGVQVVAALPAGTNVIGHVITDTGSTTAVSNFPATQPVSGTVTANQGTAGASPWPVSAAQSGTWNITNVSGTVSLPTGASTSALQTTGNTSLSSIDGKFGSLGQKNMAGSAPVVIASDQSSLPVVQQGLTTADLNVKNSGTVTSGAYVQIIASTAAAAKGLYIFDSSGYSLYLAFGAAASEVNKYVIPPGGPNGFVPLAIPAGTRLSLKAVSTTADYTAAENIVTLLG